MIRNICYELLEKTWPTTDILLRFEDKGINKEKYTFIKERIDNYSLIANRKYRITVNSKYDESNKILSIGLIISIPDKRESKNLYLEQIINDHSYNFIKFYERNNKLFKA
jgi:hypothetical protein